MPMPTPEDRAAGRAPLGFLVFLAAITSVVALTIDAILPAMDGIATDLAFDDPGDQQWLVLVVFVGLGLGQPVFGPIADALGRRRTAAIGWAIYGVGTVIAMTAPGLTGILIGRFLQGVGSAGPRVVATAIVRDLYEGRAMARIVSLIMTIFMAVPMIAPLIGQGLEAIGGWRAIFVLYIAMALGCVGWHLLRIPETLAPEDRRPLSFGPTVAAFREVVTTRTTVLYTLATGTIFSSFAALLASAQQVYEDLFGLGPAFPLVFAGVAGVLAVGQFTSSRLVMRMGMRRLCRIGGWMVLLGGSATVAVTLLFYGPMPPLWLFLLGSIPIFMGAAWQFSNLTALALEPMGHIAGTASSVVMSVSTLIAAPIGGLIAGQVETTVMPILIGFTVLGAITLALILLADLGREEAVP